MNILITGTNGFIAKYLRSHFEDKHVVYSISRKTKLGVQLINEFEVDLSNLNFVKEVFSKQISRKKIDVIIHCAAVLSGSDNKDIEVFHINNAITESMIHIAEITKAPKFINISSIGVYPNTTGTYTEKSAVEPSVNHECLYGLSKVCSEELFKFYLKAVSQVINLRLGQVYGQGMRNDRIFSLMKDELKKNNTITVFGNGERISNFLSIGYLINKIDEIIHNTEISGTFNLGEKNISYAELADMIIKEFGNDSSKIILDESGLASRVIIDCSKINSL
jgi:nucleoside-diphosphate-sugar epimerase